MKAGCEHVHAILLERRIKREIARPSVAWSADQLWMQRFQLSRLQTSVDALEHDGPAVPENNGSASPPSAASNAAAASLSSFDLVGWRTSLVEKRDEFAELAAARLETLETESRAEASQSVVQAAVDEVSETIAFLEDMTLDSAVARLSLMRDDLATLSAMCWQWACETPDDVDQVPEAEPQLAAVTSEFDETAHDAEAGSIAEAEAETAAQRDQEKKDAIRRLRRQARRVDRLSRQVRAAWQEKVLALRMEATFGRRFVDILENTVLALIFVLFILIAAQVVLERTTATGLSIAQHEFFAWTDLAICSVFLFEFAIKLVLAPNRLIYFARHFVIDFVASLPFGFVFHQIALEQLESAVAAPSAAVGPFREFVRIARVSLRFIRVAVPILRLLRIPLMLLRLSDRLVRRMAGLLNRNIVLFEPLQNQKDRIERSASPGHVAKRARSCAEHGRDPARSRAAPAGFRAYPP